MISIFSGLCRMLRDGDRACGTRLVFLCVGRMSRGDGSLGSMEVEVTAALSWTN